MLIDQDSENSSPFDQVDRSKVAPPAIEGLQAKPPPVAVDQFVEVLVALRLEDSTDRDIPYSSDQLVLRRARQIAKIVSGLQDFSGALRKGFAKLR